ncbi:MAG: GTPase domain-containing protein [Geminicoccaceae bacterium]
MASKKLFSLDNLGLLFLSASLVIYFSQTAIAVAQTQTPAADPIQPSSTELTVVIGLLATALGAAVAGAIQEILKQRIVQGYFAPPSLGRNARRNSIIVLGIERVGKTTLIRQLFEDRNANPFETTNEYSIYSKEMIVEDIKYHMYASDYAGQDIGSLIGAFLGQQKRRYSPMSYGHVNSVILIVDLFTKADRGEPDPETLNSPLQSQIDKQLDQWNDLAIDAVFGLLTENTFKYFCLFVNKIDLLSDQSKESQERYGALFSTLKDRIINRAKKEAQNIEVDVIVGSAEQGAGTHRLREKLREYSVSSPKKTWLPWG